MIYKLLIEGFQIFKLAICSSENVEVLRQSHQVKQVCRKNKLLHFLTEEICETFVQINDLSVHNSYPRYLLVNFNPRLHHSVLEVNNEWLEVRVDSGDMVMERVDLLLEFVPHLRVLNQLVGYKQGSVIMVFFSTESAI